MDQPGDFRTKRTCKLQTTVTTPFPGKTTTVPNSMSTTVNGYTIIQTSSASVNGKVWNYKEDFVFILHVYTFKHWMSLKNM